MTNQARTVEEPSPVERAVRWGGLGLILGAIAVFALGLPGGDVVGPWMFWLGAACYVVMSVRAGMRETRRRRAAR